MATARTKKKGTLARRNQKTVKTTTRGRVSRTASKGRTTRAESAPGSPNGKTARAGNAKVGVDQKQQLQKDRVQVENELALLRAELQEAPDMTGDEVDLNVYEREKTLGLVASYERRLEEINAALRAAERGKYGICERCGNPIDPERLKIFPETRLCISCKNEVEKETRRMRL
jgi:RNA polymerase-binding transcription factor